MKLLRRPISASDRIPDRLCHQNGISVAESQTFLLEKRPSAAMSEEKRLPFAGKRDARHSLSTPFVTLSSIQR